MSISDNMRITVKVCQLYYESNLSQKEISGQLGISRPQVSRILANAKSSNIVSIKINNPFTNETKLEQSLVKKYPLKDALVLDTRKTKGTQRLEMFGNLAAEYLDAYIPDDSRVGVMSGKTISSVAWSLQKFNRHGLEFIPLVGGISSSLAKFHANSICQRLAECSGGSSAVLNAPYIVQSEESCAVLKSEPGIAEVLKKGLQCDVAIIGIGQINPKSTTVQAGSLTQKDLEFLKDEGAVASVCASYLNERGKIIDTEINRRSIGIPLDRLKKCKTIAFAFGKSKIESIKATLLGGYIDILITDLETAGFIIENQSIKTTEI